MSKRQKTTGGGSGKAPFSKRGNLKYSAKQWAAIKDKLKKSGKWDDRRARPGTSRDPDPIDIDSPFSEEEDLPETEPFGGKSNLMSSNEPVGDLSVRDSPVAGYGYKRKIYSATSNDDQIYMESGSKRAREIYNFDLPVFYERGDVFNEARETQPSFKNTAVSRTSQRRGGIEGVPNSEEYIRDSLLIIDGEYNITWGELKHKVNAKNLGMLQEYFQSYNSICIIFKCLPDLLANVTTELIYDTLLSHISDPFILISERSAEGMLHWHMIWLTSKRTDNAKRLLQKFLLPVSKHFSISCQQTKSFKHIMRYILKHPLKLGVANSPTLRDYAIALLCEDVVYQKPNAAETTDNQMITAILNIMKDHRVYTTEELMRVAPNIMIKYLQKSNLDAIIQNCKLFLLKPGDIRFMFDSLFKDFIPGDFFRLYAFADYQTNNADEFFLDFFNIFCKLPSKHNVFVIQGSSNSGKTTFIRPLLELFSFGEIVSGGQFMFQNCINKELLIWEEPLIGPDFVEMCKRVFEGMTTQVPVKFKAPQTLHRTPILITTNKDVWYYCTGDEAALLNRMCLYFFNEPAIGISHRPVSWWRECFDRYRRFCRSCCKYVTTADEDDTTGPQRSRSPALSESSRTSEQLHSDGEHWCTDSECLYTGCDSLTEFG